MGHATAQHKDLFLETIQARRLAPAETDDLRNRRQNGRSASGGKIFNGRTENGKFNGRNRPDESQRRGNGNINARGIHLPVREQRDGALVLGLGGVGVKPFVQRGRRGEEVQQQNEKNRQDSK